MNTGAVGQCQIGWYSDDSNLRYAFSRIFRNEPNYGSVYITEKEMSIREFGRQSKGLPTIGTSLEEIRKAVKAAIKEAKTLKRGGK